MQGEHLMWIWLMVACVLGAVAGTVELWARDVAEFLIDGWDFLKEGSWLLLCLIALVIMIVFNELYKFVKEKICRQKKD